MCLEVKSDYQMSSWLKSIFRDEFRVFGASRYPSRILLGPFRGSGDMLPRKILKLEPLRFG